MHLPLSQLRDHSPSILYRNSWNGLKPRIHLEISWKSWLSAKSLSGLREIPTFV